MSALVIQEEESENADACFLSLFLSAEAGPAREPEKNTESASNLLNSSLIRDKC